MEIDQDLTRLYGALSSFSVRCSDNHKLQMLGSLFQKIEETAKTKMVFFMILNTRMTATNELLRDETVHAVTRQTQNLDYPALSYVMFNLHLVENLGEIVSNCPAGLTVELFSGVFAYADERIHVRGLQKVVIGLFKKILKISDSTHPENCYSYILWEFMNSFSYMLWCGSSFDREELMEEDINNILDTCLACVIIYQGSRPLPNNPLYELKVLDGKLRIGDKYPTHPVDCRDKFKQYVNRVLDLFNDIYNTFFIYDPIESLTDVAEAAFALYEKLQNSDIEPSNLSYLDEIKKRPEAEIEKMAQSDIGTIIDRILNTPVPEKWLKSLIMFPYLTETEEAMACLKDNMNYVEPQDRVATAVIIQERFKKNPVSSDSLIDLYLCCLRRMSLADLLLQFESYFELDQRPNLETSTFDEEITKLFNKMLVRDNLIKSRLVILCIQSPVKTIKKICEHAIFNAEQLQCCALDLKMLKAACLIKNFSSEEKAELDIISSVLCKMIDNGNYGPGEKTRLIGLIQRLQKKDILDVNIENFLLNMIHKEHSLANYDKVEFGLDILRTSIRSNSIRSNEIVLLAFFSQLLSQTSWSCSSFTAKLVKVREILISNIHTLMKNSKDSANDIGLVWLRNEIMKTGEINRIHFCELWHSYDLQLATSSDLYIQLLILIHTKTKIRSTINFIVRSFQSQKLLTLRISFTAAFIQILPVITYRGWTILKSRVKAIICSWLEFRQEKSDIDANLVLFRIFTMSLYSLSQDMNQNEDMITCFSYCLRNFGRMIQENFLTDTDLKYEVAVVFMEELLFLLNGVKDPELRKEVSILLSPVIFGIGNLAKKNTSGEGTKITDLENWYKKNFIGDSGIDLVE